MLCNTNHGRRPPPASIVVWLVDLNHWCASRDEQKARRSMARINSFCGTRRAEAMLSLGENEDRRLEVRTATALTHQCNPLHPPQHHRKHRRQPQLKTSTQCPSTSSSAIPILITAANPSHFPTLLLLRVRLPRRLDNIFRSLNAKHHRRDTREETRHIRKSTSIHHPQSLCPSHPKLAIQNRHLVSIGSNLTTRRSMVTISLQLEVLCLFFLSTRCAIAPIRAGMQLLER